VKSCLQVISGDRKATGSALRNERKNENKKQSSAFLYVAGLISCSIWHAVVPSEPYRRRREWYEVFRAVRLYTKLVLCWVQGGNEINVKGANFTAIKLW